jgi:hypothetical protein
MTSRAPAWLSCASRLAGWSASGLVSLWAGSDLPPSARQHKVHLAPAAPRANQPLGPVTNRRFGTVALGLLGGIGLDLVPASPAPHDDTHLRRRRAAEGRGWAAVGFHLRRLYRPSLGSGLCTQRVGNQGFEMVSVS